MKFLKEHLTGKAYVWPLDLNITFKPAPDRNLFDRFNGNHLLYMINYFGVSIGQLNINNGQKIEQLITKLPFDIKSHLSVFNWLKAKYLYCWN